MKKQIVVEEDDIKKTMISEGWKYLGTTDIEVWGKDKERILYCPKSKKIKSQYSVPTKT